MLILIEGLKKKFLPINMHDEPPCERREYAFIVL